MWTASHACASARPENTKVLQRLKECGDEFDLLEASDDALDLCALENGFFCPRHGGVLGLDPVSLQLQWRVSPERDFLGAQALASLQANPPPRRIAWVVGRPGDECPAPGQPVRRDDTVVGTLLEAKHSPILGRSVGLALIDRGLSHPGVDGFRVGSETPEVELELAIDAPPLIRSRSLFVNPHRHAYASRSEDSFPPLARSDA